MFLLQKTFFLYIYNNNFSQFMVSQLFILKPESYACSVIIIQFLILNFSASSSFLFLILFLTSPCFWVISLPYDFGEK
jgi:hypothetical protein